MRGFASDNQSGVHPKMLAAIAQANIEHAPSYGGDEWTERAKVAFAKHVGAAETLFVFNGTGANVVALKSVLMPYEAVICAETAHLNVDECGAPEVVGGFKLIAVPTAHGKLTVADVEQKLVRLGDEHHVQPRVVSITQATELGTVYSLDELRTLSAFCKKQGLLLHVDGSRLLLAAASLGVSLKAMTADVGVDVLSFGGTKNALLFGEAVVFFDKALAKHARYIRKQSLQLYSKNRFIAAQFLTLLDNELWLQNARHANAMAKRLEVGVASLDFVKVTHPVQANSVFAILPKAIAKKARERYFFYEWDENTGECRWMTSFDTTEGDIDGFVALLRDAAR